MSYAIYDFMIYFAGKAQTISYQDIVYNIICFLQVVTVCLPWWFKCSPILFRCALFESNAASARPIRLSVFFGLEIELQWFTNPY